MSSAAAGILTVVILAPAALSPDSGPASLLARDGADTLLVRPPAKRPVSVPLVREEPAHGVVIARPPDRRPLVSPSVVRRDA